MFDCGLVPPVPRLSWLGCVCMGSGLWLRPATPDWGVAVCVFWCASSACPLPFLVGLWCVCVGSVIGLQPAIHG